ncbi:MAG: SDR family NAD(P)-dependent oxidoreductase [Chloroflexota bacterium]
MMKAFVTGGTGLLGSNLVEQLIAAGYEVTALARSEAKAAQLLGTTRAQIIIGDMENVAAFESALKGVDVLFHTAAYFREYFGPGDHWGTLEKINVQGTIQLLEAAERQGVKKAIYVSSSTVIGMKADGSAGDESTPPNAGTLDNLYRKSKVLAEKAIFAFLKTHTLPVVLILPSAMFGPRDAAPTSPGQIVLDFLGHKLPAIPPGGFSVVDARDVAKTMLNAVELGKSGERYIVSNQYQDIGDILVMLSHITGIPAPSRHLPYRAALAYAYMMDMRTRLTGISSPVSVVGIRLLKQKDDVRSDKARRELGTTIRPFEETLRDEVNWYIQNGYVPKNVLQSLARAQA